MRSNTRPSTRSLDFKPDFEATVQRFEAWWHGEVIDRPPVTLSVRPQRAGNGPKPHHGTLRQRWLDAEYQVDNAIASLQRRTYPGDSFPIYMPNVGPELTATLLGCELVFTETTSWAEPVVHTIDQWDAIVGRPLDFSNPYWQAIEQMTDLALERCEGRFMVGVTDLHNNYDTMAALRDPMALCLDLADDPELIGRVGRDLRRVFTDAFDRLWQRIAAAGMGCTTWCPIYHEGPCYLPSCDFWCMLGSDIARQMILPDVHAEMTPLERSLFHLDGPQALRHLDLLLEMPNLDAVQWVYGAGNEPATRWLEVYRRVLAAGKSVQVVAEADEALELLEVLGAKGVWLTITTTFGDTRETDSYLNEVSRLSNARSR